MISSWICGSSCKDGVCRPQCRYQGTGGGFEGQEKSIEERGGEIDTDAEQVDAQSGRQEEDGGGHHESNRELDRERWDDSHGREQ